jgi:hypothetical protein
MLKRVMTTDKNGRDGVPQLFSCWGERLNDWGVVVKDDAGMEEEFERLTQGEVKRDADPKAGQELKRCGPGAEEMRALLPKGMLKADVLRCLRSTRQPAASQRPVPSVACVREQVPRREEAVQGRGQAGRWLAAVRWIGGTRTDIVG